MPIAYSALDKFFPIVLISQSMTHHKFQDAYYMLEISRAELQSLIQSQLQENPALELDESLTAESSASGKKQRVGSLVPDVRIEPNGNRFVVMLTDSARPLRINPLYERMAAQKIRIEGRVDYPFFIEKARAAKWFIKAIEQRQSTILKVTEGVFKFQRELLRRGLNHIRPMSLRDLAEHVSLPESVVVRAAANKWVETPHALFALDWFFAEPKRDTANKR
jgi:DNA-directed RNA polymerase specialized sigma54-like protein